MKSPGLNQERIRGGNGIRRRWMPLAVIAACAVTVTVLQLSESIEGNWRWLFTLLTVFMAMLLTLVWFLFLSGLRWRIRLRVFGGLVLGVIALGQLLRFDGSANGTAFPRIVWRWTPKRDGNVGGFRWAGPAPTSRPRETGLASDYPGFLGRERNGVVQGIDLERDWTVRPPQQLWRQPIGLGWSGFAVSGSRAVTQEQRGSNELVVCYQSDSGRVLWAHTNLVCFRERMGGDGPRATPTLADGRVYALGATGMLDCLDLGDGRPLWSRNVLAEPPAPNLPFGKSCSPLVFDDLVVVTGGQTNGPSLLAYHRQDGSTAWSSGTNEVSYSSPTLVTLCGRRQVLSLGVALLTAHDPKDGRILWEYHWKEASRAFIASQPAALDGDRVFLSAGFGAGCVLLHVTLDEAGRFSAAEVWKNRNMKTHFSSVVVRDGFAYGLDDETLVCLDLATGDRKWKEGRYGHGQLLRVGDLLLVQTERGPVTLVEAVPSRYREVSTLGALDSKTWNTPALAGGLLVVRNDEEAACYRLPLQTGNRAAR